MNPPTDFIAQATAELRERSTRRAVEVADDVLRNALRASRTSLPIRARGDNDFARVSDQVLITLLRAAIDQALERAAVGRIVLLVDHDQILQRVTIELFVQFGEILIEVGDRVHDVAQRLIDEVLGVSEPTIEVAATHVHVSDVTSGDPHLAGPED
jgi:hypothetical protein